MKTLLSKLKLLLWKAFVIRKRHKIILLMEIILPIAGVLLLAWAKTKLFTKQTYVESITHHEPTNLRENKPEVQLLYSPYNSEIDKLIELVKERVKVLSTSKFRTGDEIYLFFVENARNMVFDVKPTIGIIFEDFPDNALPEKLKYTIRMRMRGVFGTAFPIGPSWSLNDHINYIHSDFCKMQMAVDLAFIELKAASGKNRSIEISLEEVPYPPHRAADTSIEMMVNMLEFLIIITFAINMSVIIKNIIHEKISGIKELMKMMGMDEWMIWIGWIMYAMLLQLPIILIIVVLLKITIFEDEPVLPNSGPLLLYTFLLLYCFTVIFYSFLITSIFTSVAWGSNLGILIWFVLFCLTPYVTANIEGMSRFLVILVLLVPNFSIDLGLKEIVGFESAGGKSFANLYTKQNPDSQVPSCGVILIMMAISCILFMLLVWYLQNVRPGPYGNARRLNFLCMKSYWVSRKIELEQVDERYDDRPEIEEVPSNLQAGIQIRKLKKIYKNNCAVDNLNLDIYTKQITILLGHNGAGKTTTMNMITGMFSATSGTILVDGYNIETDLNKVRSSLGLCPQHELHFKDLTILEHLMFFAMLKGKTRAAAKRDSLNYLASLSLSHKANEMTKNLSGGMQRKLSLGMALVGDPKVLMLDEPTSGLDLEGRREIWDYLLTMRGERTILITTHHMEEAEILGDRIAIMHHGTLVCYGTSLFLKKFYGMGYSLSLITNPTWNQNALISEIQKFVPLANITRVTAGVASVSLPSNNTQVLAKLFTHLDRSKAGMGIKNFSVSITSLEDVFLIVGELSDKRTGKKVDSPEPSSSKYYNDKVKNAKTNSKLVMWLTQSMALIIKRLQYTKHRWITTIIPVIIPVLLHLILFLLILPSETKNNTGFPLTLQEYPNSETFYKSNNEKLGEKYSQVVRNQGGSATKAHEVPEVILEKAKISESSYLKTIVAAAELNDTDGQFSCLGYFGAAAIHGPAISLNLITNTLLKTISDNDANSISIKNNPLPIDVADNLDINGFLVWCTMIPFGYSFLLMFLLIFPQEEKMTGVKHLQILYGVPRIKYWFIQMLLDYLLFCIAACLCIFIVLILANNQHTNGVGLVYLACLTFEFGLAILPFYYIFSYFKNPTTSSICVMMIALVVILSGMILILSSYILLDSYPEVITILNDCLSIFPIYVMADGIFKFCVKSVDMHSWNNMEASEQATFCQMMTHACCMPDSEACSDFNSFLSGVHSMNTNFLFLGIEIVVYWLILLLIDFGFFTYCLGLIGSCLCCLRAKTDDSTLDEDVKAENDRVAEQMKEKNSLNDLLLVGNIKKFYGRFNAVRGISFGVKKNNCFGLLGVNGAGKTTMFRILTGDIFASKGNARILDFSLNRNKRKFLESIGYCPQFDALNMYLTTREMLTCFARIRGIKSEQLKSFVDFWLNKFDIKKYENTTCNHLSGGNKRKLSTAIAMVGDPPLIMLDEPTSGVDPIARRHLWSILTSVRQSGQSIILTSHSMDECEALCDSVGIMVDGQMKCLGNVQYLKNKFGQGFTIMITLRNLQVGSDALQTLKNTIEKRYTCVLKDEHIGMLLYHVTTPNISIGDVFAFMEDVKQQQNIVEDFTVSDTTMEQVFLAFAKERLNKKPQKKQKK